MWSAHILSLSNTPQGLFISPQNAVEFKIPVKWINQYIVIKLPFHKSKRHNYKSSFCILFVFSRKKKVNLHIARHKLGKYTTNHNQERIIFIETEACNYLIKDRHSCIHAIIMQMCSWKHLMYKWDYEIKEEPKYYKSTAFKKFCQISCSAVFS